MLKFTIPKIYYYLYILHLNTIANIASLAKWLSCQQCIVFKEIGKYVVRIMLSDFLKCYELQMGVFFSWGKSTIRKG